MCVPMALPGIDVSPISRRLVPPFSLRCMGLTTYKSNPVPEMGSIRKLPALYQNSRT
eukprot:m.474593 g.474593  ORF g.474593 m.474593 type:complete len:57 (+) comp36655_c0_seq1:1786-1956(+)